jgi:hypothetical protein
VGQVGPLSNVDVTGMAQEQNVDLRNVFPTRKRKRSKVAETIADVCFTVILIRDGTLEKETKVVNLCRIEQMSPFVPQFSQQSRLPDKHKTVLVYEGQRPVSLLADP